MTVVAKSPIHGGMAKRSTILDIDAFFSRCDAYCDARAISRARLSNLLLNDSRALARLADRGGLTVHSLNKAHERLSELEAQLSEPKIQAAGEGAAL